jgi:1-deoxy-D-xylulose-5-phosphate reductoisomerase
METRHIALLGSTGSIGTNALKVISLNRDRFRLIGLAAGENISLVTEQIKTFDPPVVGVKNKTDGDYLKKLFPEKTILWGNQGLEELVSDRRVDTVIASINGTSALSATMIAIEKNHRICLANKETLVVAGELINQALEHSQSEIIPVDSEQSAIFQCIGSNKSEFIKRIILTASGGPFFRTPKHEFPQITVRQALAHPTWQMGTKITLDSATLMNKALEIIEAHYLFKLRSDQIEPVIHPQSIVHSVVEFIDSSLIAQLSWPDMKIPILYSLTYPERNHFPKKNLDLAELKKLEFYPVEKKKFSSIKMAYQVLKMGKNAGAVFNTANEVAAEYFLNEKISFDDIFEIVENILAGETFYPIHCLDDLNRTIEETRQKTIKYIQRRLFK